MPHPPAIKLVVVAYFDSSAGGVLLAAAKDNLIETNENRPFYRGMDLKWSTDAPPVSGDGEKTGFELESRRSRFDVIQVYLNDNSRV